MQRARIANAVVAAEHARVGWGKTEQTVDRGSDNERRLDIASIPQKRGMEIKAYESGIIYASEDIASEVGRDARLVKRGWKITWLLVDTQASAPLLKLLYDAGITVEFRVTQGKTTVFDSRILPPRK
jgi:hypothetical protein